MPSISPSQPSCPARLAPDQTSHGLPNAAGATASMIRRVISVVTPMRNSQVAIFPPPSRLATTSSGSGHLTLVAHPTNSRPLTTRADRST